MVPYMLPSSVELADATIRALDDDYDVVMWEKHGVLAVDTDIMSAFDQVDVLNKAALIYIAAKNMGFEPDGMTDAQMQEISDDDIEMNAIRVYPRLYEAYQQQKQFIPEGNLYEVKFEEFERDAYAVTKDIYGQLQLPCWEESEPAIRTYIESKRGYKKNQYEYKPRTIQLVNEYWGQAIDDWGYERRG